MIAIPVSGEVARRAVRTLAVAAVAVTALAISLPNMLFSPNPPVLDWHWLDFRTAGNVVVRAGPDARAAGIDVGDRIEYSRMAPHERYGPQSDGLRPPLTGDPISFIVNRHGTLHAAKLWPYGGYMIDSPIRLIASVAIALVIFLLASALVLLRPTPLTAGLFLYAAPTGALPLAWRFLTPEGYAVVMAANDVLAGLSAIGFLALATYFDPARQIRPRLFLSASALLLAVIVVPILTSDALELVLGIRPAWPIAGWASFSAVWLCFVTGFALLLRLAARATASNSLRLLAAYFATVGALHILDWTLYAQLSAWYSANLPGAVMTRWLWPAFPANVWGLPVWQVAARLTAALGISFALLHGGLLTARSRLFRVAAYGGLTLAIAAVLLQGPFLHGPLGAAYQLLRELALLLAFYAIVRTRIADAGPVFNRIVSYVIVALLAVAVFAVANVDLMRRFDKYAPIVPLEIFAAMAIGYWVSGLRDLAGCLSLACVDAWNAWANGHARDERDALSRSLGLAERTRRQGVIAEVRGQIAFGAWRDGDDMEFERNADALQRIIRSRKLRGIHGFAHAATDSDGELCFSDDDLPEWRARAALVLCARTNDAARAQRLALDALASADRSGLASLQVLGSIAVAETCPDQRNASLKRAHAIARDAGWPALSKSILALRANARDIGILQAFVEVRLRKSRPARPMFEISFFNAALSQNGVRVSLPAKQLELLLTVASARTGINDNDLIDALWADSEGDAARNSFRVCLHGLRKSAGDPRIITRVGKGYAVHPWADVDLWRFQSLLSSYRESGGRDRAHDLRELCDALRAGQGRRATLGEWFYRFEQTLNRKLDEAERLLDRDAERRLPT